MKHNSESYAKTADFDQIQLLRRISSKIQEPRDQIIFKLILETGCTPKEIVELKPEDIEFTTCSLTIGSKRKKRTVKISLELSLLLNSFISTDKEARHVFSTRQSKKISKRRIAQIVEENAFSLAGKELTPISLRKISIRATFARTKSIAKTKAITGLKSLVEKEHLTKEQVEKIRGEIKDLQHRLIFDILYETGCLPSELVSLRREDIDFHNHSIIFKAENARNRQERNSKIKKELSLQIKLFADKEGKSSEDFLFSTRQSSKISDKRVFQLVRQYSEIASFKNVSPRTIRNTSIALARSEGVSDEKISEQVGIKHLSLHHYGLTEAKKKEVKTKYDNS